RRNVELPFPYSGTLSVLRAMSTPQKRTISERTAENAAVQVAGTFATLGAVATERELKTVTAMLAQNTQLLYGVSAIIADPNSRELVADANMVQALVRLAKDDNLRGLLLGVQPDAAALITAARSAKARKLRSAAERMKHLYMAGYMEAVVIKALRRLNKHDFFNADESGSLPPAVQDADLLKGIVQGDLVDVFVVSGAQVGDKLKDLDLETFTESAGWFWTDGEKKTIQCSIDAKK
ncbi:unnamed protein product, partial [Prorocentrum cordatum]